MKIIIAANIYPPEVGGPAHYIKSLEEEFRILGHKVSVVKYGFLKKLPTGLRHFLYFFKLTIKSFGADVILAMDTFSVGVPVAVASKLFGKKSIVRTGGDFLWESYVDRSKNKVLLSEFYDLEFQELINLKERIVFNLTKWSLKQFNGVVFSTEWQKSIWQKPYKINPSKIFILKNSFPKREKSQSIEGNKANRFLWAGRKAYLKNTDKLREAFDLAKSKNQNLELKMLSGVSREVLYEEIKNSRALVIPSLSEVSPNIILESVSLGVPFILTKDTGLYQEFHNLGLFIDPKSKEDITQKILQMSDDEEYKVILENIKSFSYSSRGYDKIAQEFTRVFNES